MQCYALLQTPYALGGRKCELLIPQRGRGSAWESMGVVCGSNREISAVGTSICASVWYNSNSEVLFCGSSWEISSFLCVASWLWQGGIQSLDWNGGLD